MNKERDRAFLPPISSSVFFPHSSSPAAPIRVRRSGCYLAKSGHYLAKSAAALPHPLRPLRFPIRCGLPKSVQESPNGGASKGTSPPSSPLEQKPADPCRPGTRRQARSSYTRRPSCTR
ncbi:hypothetical protein PVAP13_5NG415380 [Panicum virgatum]|uniref:Uncharacterized protein n=1 Tax=Panicum virgatum TaxID=38727 RepID=A0A8T0S163_PANVG|nr:hypothetical protein PVAP13_5NG415380 [Panicum virgatum]